MIRFFFILVMISLLPVAAIAAGGDSDGEYQVVVSSRSLPIGHVITRSDVRIAYMNKADKRVVTELDDAIGSQVKRTIGRSTTLKSNYLKNPSVVRKGDTIIIIASRGGLKVTAKGIAKASGEIGDVVRVENMSSGEYVDAEIIGPAMGKVYF